MSTSTQAAPAAASILNLPPIGTMLEEHGGELAAIQRARPGSGQADYAIIVPHDGICEVRKRAWGGYGHDLAGAACMWDGQANTEALLASEHEHPIAEALREARRLPGLADLYLPSLRELKALFANGCEAFDQTLWYWSSTQYGRSFAFGQDFSTAPRTSAARAGKAAPLVSPAGFPFSPSLLESFSRRVAPGH